ncbi:Mitochondrial zinc maintenance protein 1, mitochondrial [Orbilia ellipsospora]|uniref:Mitochondrial zinc maintenance protein 1, mitochondrial n=1 Tax=Orbilia ellipsospora TaxID=2528407 RepID=A0AAV9XMS3_9PEZI
MSAIQAYRSLLRASRLAFQGDSRLLLASQHQIRSQFERERDNPESEAKDTADSKIQHAFEVAKYLRQNIVQAAKAEGEDTFKLRIHDETERGDNESVKSPLKGRVGKFKRCS